MEFMDIMQCLGVGKHSATYLATDLIHSCKVVLKFLDWPANIERFNSHHESVVMTLALFPVSSTCVVPEGLPFCPKEAVIFEYCDEGNLDTWMLKYQQANSSHKLQVFKKIVEGLDYLHRLGLVHGNIKSSNVVFKAGIPKLCDRMLVRPGSQVVCPSHYSAPELHGEPGMAASEISDFFSLGVLLVQLFSEPGDFSLWLNGSREFVPDSHELPSYARMPLSLVVSYSFLDLIRALLRHSPEKRLSSTATNRCVKLFIDNPGLTEAWGWHRRSN